MFPSFLFYWLISTVSLPTILSSVRCSTTVPGCRTLLLLDNFNSDSENKRVEKKQRRWWCMHGNNTGWIKRCPWQCYITASALCIYSWIVHRAEIRLYVCPLSGSLIKFINVWFSYRIPTFPFICHRINQLRFIHPGRHWMCRAQQLVCVSELGFNSVFVWISFIVL